MTDNAARRDRMAAQEVTAQLLQRRHLFCGKSPVTPFVAGIDDLDPERDRVEVALTLPAGMPGMKRPPRFWNELPDEAAFLDQIMSADPGRGIAQPVECRRGAHHTGIMQHQ